MAGALEDLWADVLSESPDRISRRLAALDQAERQAILLHLEAMTRGDGWSEGQRRRAAFALAQWIHRRSDPGVPEQDARP